MIQINGPNGISFRIKDRYSSMLAWYEDIKKSCPSESLPAFPEKKMFGNKKPEFLETRRFDLRNFLISFLNLPAVKMSPKLLPYFKMKINDPRSAEQLD